MDYDDDDIDEVVASNISFAFFAFFAFLVSLSLSPCGGVILCGFLQKKGALIFVGLLPKTVVRKRRKAKSPPLGPPHKKQVEFEMICTYFLLPDMMGSLDYCFLFCLLLQNV